MSVLIELYQDLKLNIRKDKKEDVCASKLDAKLPQSVTHFPYHPHTCKLARVFTKKAPYLL